MESEPMLTQGKNPLSRSSEEDWTKSDTRRHNIWNFYSLLIALLAVSNMYTQMSKAQLHVKHMQHIQC